MRPEVPFSGLKLDTGFHPEEAPVLRSLQQRPLDGFG